MQQANHANAPSIIPSLSLREVKTLSAPAAKTATANITGVDMIDVGPEESFAVLHVGTTSGTLPTLDVVIEESTDNSTWTTAATFEQKTAAGIEMLKFTRTKRYLRAGLTITGTTPSFIVGVTVGH